jgi:hypothetical protein
MAILIVEMIAKANETLTMTTLKEPMTLNPGRTEFGTEESGPVPVVARMTQLPLTVGVSLRPHQTDVKPVKLLLLRVLSKPRRLFNQEADRQLPQ